MVTADLADDNRVNMISSIQQDRAILRLHGGRGVFGSTGATSESVARESLEVILSISWKQPDIAGAQIVTRLLLDSVCMQIQWQRGLI